MAPSVEAGQITVNNLTYQGMKTRLVVLLDLWTGGKRSLLDSCHCFGVYIIIVCNVHLVCRGHMYTKKTFECRGLTNASRGTDSGVQIFEKLYEAGLPSVHPEIKCPCCGYVPLQMLYSLPT